MSYNLSWFQSSLSDIQNEILISSKLKEMKVALSGLRSSQITQLASSLQLSILFDCLNSFERKQIEITCDLLKSFLGSLPSSYVFETYGVEIDRALKHPERCVKQLVLHELCRSDDTCLVRLILKKPSVLEECFNLIKDDDLSVAQIATGILTKVGLSDKGFDAIMTPPLITLILDCLNSLHTALYSLRVYEFLIELGIKSETKLRIMAERGVFKGLLSLLTSNDVLAKMAAMEELSKLSCCVHGYRYLAYQHCIETLAHQLISYDDPSTCSLVYPGLLKFFGCVCKQHCSEIHSSYPKVFEAILAATSSEDVVISITALETIGFIASSTKGKFVLDQLGDECIHKILQQMKEYLIKAQTDWKVRILNSLSNLLNVDEHLGPVHLGKVEKLTEKWYNWLGGELGTAYLFEISKSPFPEVKLATYEVLKKLAFLSWGQRQIANCPDALKYLLNRNNEKTMGGLNAKYAVIATLALSPTAPSVFTDDDFSRIQTYLKQGAMYMPSILKVMVEGAD